MAGTGDGLGESMVPATRAQELKVFLVSTFILIPGATVGFVGAYGLAIWVYQMIFGPPGPPG